MLRATGITKRDKIKGLAAANEGRDVVNITLEVSLQDYFSSNSLDFSSGEIPSNGLQAGGNPVFVAKRHNHRLLPQWLKHNSHCVSVIVTIRHNYLLWFMDVSVIEAFLNNVSFQWGTT